MVLWNIGLHQALEILCPSFYRRWAHDLVREGDSASTHGEISKKKKKSQNKDPCLWEKLFVASITDKIFLSKIYKEF